MKCIIIDDERLARKEINGLLSEFPYVEIVGEATNAQEAYHMIKERKPDLIFLDIQMPGKNGFELLESLNFEQIPHVIFTTAYDEYALKAFEVNAIDYLLKPIEEDRLENALEKYKNQKSKEKNNASDQEEEHEKLSLKDQVFVKDGDNCWFIALEEIRYFESDGNYIKVFFESFKPMIHKSLNNLDEKLDDKYFFRASRKHIINLSWVEKIDTWFNGGLMVTLKGGDKIEVSRRQSVRFKNKMSL